MYLHGVSAHEAWKQLSMSATLRCPDLGVVFNTA
jgi:hypothetical protein